MAALILYGSQTGTAQEISRCVEAEIVDGLGEAGWTTVLSMAQWMDEAGGDVRKLGEARVVVLICSTTGNGDPPDNASKFWRKVKALKEEGWLQGVPFALLGLGDSNYDQFCQMGKNLEREFRKSGAVPIAPAVFADEATGLEEQVDSWKRQAIPAILQVLRTPDTREAQKQGGAKNDIRKGTFEVESSAWNRTVEPKEEKDLPRWRAPKAKVRVLEEKISSSSRLIGCAGPKDDISSRRWSRPNSSDVEQQGQSPEFPMAAKVKAARFLTSEESPKQVIHIELILPEKLKSLCSVGDSIGIYCPNHASVVEWLIKRLKIDDADQLFTFENGADFSHIITPCSIREALLFCCALDSIPQKAHLRALAEYCEDDQEREALYGLCSRSKESRAKYNQDVLAKKMSFLDLLSTYSSCLPNLGHLLEMLPPLNPRYYSIANLPAAHQSEVHIALTVVQDKSLFYPSEVKRGICSNWLYRYCRSLGLLPPRSSLDDAQVEGFNSPIIGSIALDSNDESQSFSSENLAIPVFLKKTDSFRPPSDIKKPMIMIGPGTGVSPFRGFIEDRSEKMNNLVSMYDQDNPDFGGDIGPCWLFFGCRKPDWDFIYGEEFEDFHQKGILTKFNVAYSRKTGATDKYYVQHAILENAEEIYSWIFNEHAMIYVCGDASAMAKDVMSTITQVIESVGGLSPKEAAEYVTELKKTGRYLQDIWS